MCILKRTTTSISASKPKLGCGRQLALHVKAANYSSSNTGFGDDAMNTLKLRIQQQLAAERTEKILNARPELPVGNKTWNEVTDDHALITRWHEAAWETLRKATAATNT
jgi:hypothetical protein